MEAMYRHSFSEIISRLLLLFVYQLESGLPRMISKRKLYIQNNIIVFLDINFKCHNAIETFHQIGKEQVKSFDFIDFI
jgi:hypothetical protein